MSIIEAVWKPEEVEPSKEKEEATVEAAVEAVEEPVKAETGAR